MPRKEKKKKDVKSMKQARKLKKVEVKPFCIPSLVLLISLEALSPMKLILELKMTWNWICCQVGVIFCKFEAFFCLLTFYGWNCVGFAVCAEQNNFICGWKSTEQTNHDFFLEILDQDKCFQSKECEVRLCFMIVLVLLFHSILFQISSQIQSIQQCFCNPSFEKTLLHKIKGC